MFAQLKSVALFYHQVGSGEPLLFLHGNSEDHTIFKPLVEKLKDHFAIYAIDSRDHGQSGLTGQINYDLMAEDIHEFIEKLGLKQVNLVGFSDGAIVGLIMGMKYPQDLLKMILMGPNTDPDDLSPEAVRFLHQIIKDHQSPQFKMIFEQPHLKYEDLAKITTQTLFIFGANDLFKDEMIDKLSKTINNSILKILPDHDHMSYLVNNDFLYPYIMDFLKK
ncbi:MAG: alpha/beta hydrolase [Deltaproteobacteria bacterium]|nr:alpha/beta hydrolase [Deltaproteobacteria bacterium]